MAIRLEKINNYLVMTDNVTGQTIAEKPAKDVFYSDDSEKVTIFYKEPTRIVKLGSEEGFTVDDVVKAGDTKFTDFADLLDFLRTNTGFSSGGGGVDGVTFNSTTRVLTLSQSDGDKGDITVSGSGAIWTIDNSAVTFAKFQNIDETRILGRASEGTGVVESLTATDIRTILNVEDGADVTDETNVVSSLSGASLTDAGTPASDDKILIQDTSDSDNLKYIDYSDIASNIQTTSITLNSTQILSLNTTPIELIPTPGAGNIILIQSIMYRYNFNTAAYATDTVVRIEYSGESSAVAISNENVLGGTADKIFVDNAYAVTIEGFENKAIDITTATSDPTAGDSTLDIYATYQTITL